MTLAAPMLLVLAAAVAAPAPPAIDIDIDIDIDIEGFAQRHADDYLSLLDHPQVECALGELVPRNELDELRARMHRTQAAHWDRDAVGGFSTTGAIRGTGPYEQGIVWAHPDRRIIAAWRSGDEMRAFTNHVPFREAPPPGLRGWFEVNARGAPPEPTKWIGRDDIEGLPAQCSALRLARALREQDGRIEGEHCDDRSSVGNEILLVRPTSPRAGLAAGRRACMPAAPSRVGRPYVIAGDLLGGDPPRGECRCVRHRGITGDVTGWIAATAVAPLGIDLEFAPADVDATLRRLREWVAGMPTDGEWAGTWRGHGHDIRVRAEGDAHRVIVISGMDGGEIDQGLLQVDGLVGRLPSDEAGHGGWLLVRLHDNLLVLEGYPTPRWGALGGVFVRAPARAAGGSR